MMVSPATRAWHALLLAVRMAAWRDLNFPPCKSRSCNGKNSLRLKDRDTGALSCAWCGDHR